MTLQQTKLPFLMLGGSAPNTSRFPRFANRNTGVTSIAAGMKARSISGILQ